MRVLIAHNRYRQAGGEDTVVAAEASLLARKGHTVARIEMDNETIEGLAATLQAGVRSFFSGPSYRHCADVIRRFRPDILHVHNFFPTLSPSVFFAAEDAAVPSVLTLHNYRFLCANAMLYRDGQICESCPQAGSFLPAVLHGCYRGSRMGSAIVGGTFDLHSALGTWRRRVHRYIALTEFSAAKLAQGPIPADRIRIKPNFVVDRGLGLGGGNFALFVGRLSDEKGLSTILQADLFSSLPLSIHIVGDGPLKEAVAAAAERPGSRLVYLGPKSSDEVSTQMYRASVLLLPSLWYEGFPMVAVEALCAGLPIIASRIGGLPEIIEDGVSGFLIRPGDHAALVEALNRFTGFSRDRAAQLRNSARNRYIENYGEATNYNLLTAIYQEAAQQHRLTLSHDKNGKRSAIARESTIEQIARPGG